MFDRPRLCRRHSVSLDLAYMFICLCRPGSTPGVYRAQSIFVSSGKLVCIAKTNKNLTTLTLRHPRYFANRKRLRGVPPPWIFAFPSKFFGHFSQGYVFRNKESNGDNENILSLLHDLENQGQTPFCMTFLISGCKHDTNSILVSILTFSRSRISKMLKNLRDLNGWSWNSRSHTFIVRPFLAPAVFMLQTWSWCRF